MISNTSLIYLSYNIGDNTQHVNSTFTHIFQEKLRNNIFSMLFWIDKHWVKLDESLFFLFNQHSFHLISPGSLLTNLIHVFFSTKYKNTNLP